MERAKKIQAKLEKRLKGLGIIKSFKFQINFYPIKRNSVKCLHQVDSVLKKNLRKIIVKPINKMSKFFRRKNLNHNVINQEQKASKNVHFVKSKSSKRITNMPVIIQCGFCDKIYDSKKSYAVHKKLHSKSKIHLCKQCGQMIQGSRKWLEHTNSHNENLGLYFSSRNYIGNVGVYKQNRERLKPADKNLKNKLMACEIPALKKTSKTSVHNTSAGNFTSKAIIGKEFIYACGKVFRLWKSFKRHEKLRLSLQNAQYICQICGKCFREKCNLNKHMLSHKESQYSCSVCSKVFARSDLLSRHLSIYHNILKHCNCHFCQIKFRLNYNWDIRQRMMHKNRIQCFRCEYCGKKFLNELAFKFHLKTHLTSTVTYTVCSLSYYHQKYYSRY